MIYVSRFSLLGGMFESIINNFQVTTPSNSLETFYNFFILLLTILQFTSYNRHFKLYIYNINYASTILLKLPMLLFIFLLCILVLPVLLIFHCVINPSLFLSVSLCFYLFQINQLPDNQWFQSITDWSILLVQLISHGALDPSFFFFLLLTPSYSVSLWINQ